MAKLEAQRKRFSNEGGGEYDEVDWSPGSTEDAIDVSSTDAQ